MVLNRIAYLVSIVYDYLNWLDESTSYNFTRAHVFWTRSQRNICWRFWEIGGVIMTSLALISATFSIISCQYSFCFFFLTGLETQHFEDLKYWIFVTTFPLLFFFIIMLCCTFLIHNTKVVGSILIFCEKVLRVWWLKTENFILTSMAEFNRLAEIFS